MPGDLRATVLDHAVGWHQHRIPDARRGSLMRTDDVAQSDGRRAASHYLQQLLLKPGPYRQTWEQHVSRSRHGAINQLAVAEVLARHLCSSPRGLADVGITSHQLKDTVSRALSGRLLSRSALSLFIEAFRFSEPEADRLWRLWNGSATITVLSGSRAVPTYAEQEVANVIGARRQQTVSMHHHIWVGSDGRIDTVRVMQVIEAIEQGVDRIPFIYDTNVQSVELGQGCKELAAPLRKVGDVFATEILLARTLDIGETLTLEYRMVHNYADSMTAPLECEQRHAVLRNLENFDMRVEFHPARLPAYLWWARWDGTEGDVIEQQRVQLDSQHSAHRYLRSITKAVVGFRWEWD
jgi:hypothetical protein